MDLSQPKTCKNTDIIILHVRRVMCVRQEFRSKPFLLNQAMDKESQHTGFDPRQIRHGNLKGRGVFSKKLKKQLYQLQNGRCAICGGQFALHELQVDHRIPYLVTDGNGELKENSADYMLLCAVHNRSKSWSCEHCQNGKQDKDVSVCATCYWASPENYSHVAMQQERRAEITWQGNEVREYEKLKRDAKKQKSNVPDYIKSLLRGMFGKK